MCVCRDPSAWTAKWDRTCVTVKSWGQYLELHERTLIGAGENGIKMWCFLIISILVTFSIEVICTYHQMLCRWLESTEIDTRGVGSDTTETGPMAVPPPHLQRSTKLLASKCSPLYPSSHLVVLFKHTGWRTKCHTIDCAHNTFLLLQKHLTSGTELILIGWKIVPNEEHVQCDHVLPHNLLQTNPCIRHNFSTRLQKVRGTTSLCGPWAACS